jgi:hypothetical protein
MPASHRERFALVLLLIGLSAPTLASCAEESRDSPPRERLRLTRERQIELALSTAPPLISEQATIYVLEAGGYVKAREGKNGFTCLVEHQLLDTYEPVCYDPEGSATLLHARFLREELRAQGLDEARVSAHLAQAFEDGRLKAPRKPGFVYMMAREQRVLEPRSKKIIDGGEPHLMIYAPYATNAEFGGVPSVLFEGQPDAFIVAPTGVAATGHKH